MHLVREGKAEALMKGSLHTDELMAAVVRRETGLRTARRVSHCFVMDVPGHENTLIITDAAVNIAPTLEEKADILLAPDLEAGNVLAKQLSFLAKADSAGIVLGARVPIILTSRADSVRSRIASCAVAVRAAHARRQALQTAAV